MNDVMSTGIKGLNKIKQIYGTQTDKFDQITLYSHGDGKLAVLFTSPALFDLQTGPVIVD